jgi:hypothetical protein
MKRRMTIIMGIAVASALAAGTVAAQIKVDGDGVTTARHFPR